MCGRYGRRSDKQRIAEWFHTRNTDVFDESTYAPSYNVAPMTFQPVVRLNRETGEREIAYMRWGLVPFWSKDSKPSYSTVNAKAETITVNATFREAMKGRRCLVPADFFYEWQKIDAKRKQPYAIGMRDGTMFAFAGLWERWKDKTSGNTLETFTVITTDPNELMEDSQSYACHPQTEGLRPVAGTRGPAASACRSAQAVSSRADEVMEGRQRCRQCQKRQSQSVR